MWFIEDFLQVLLRPILRNGTALSRLSSLHRKDFAAMGHLAQVLPAMERASKRAPGCCGGKHPKRGAQEAAKAPVILEGSPNVKRKINGTVSKMLSRITRRSIADEAR